MNEKSKFKPKPKSKSNLTLTKLEKFIETGIVYTVDNGSKRERLFLDDIVNQFLNEYKKYHKLCPKCNSSRVLESKVGPNFYLNPPIPVQGSKPFPPLKEQFKNYKDRNASECLDCGSRHTVHDRIYNIT